MIVKDMTFKEWVCFKAGISDYYLKEWELDKQPNNDEIVYLMKCMWAINRKENFEIKIGATLVEVYEINEEYYQYIRGFSIIHSEIETLTKALEYIKDNE